MDPDPRLAEPTPLALGISPNVPWPALNRNCRSAADSKKAIWIPHYRGEDGVSMDSEKAIWIPHYRGEDGVSMDLDPRLAKPTTELSDWTQRRLSRSLIIGGRMELAWTLTRGWPSSPQQNCRSGPDSEEAYWIPHYRGEDGVGMA